MPSDTITNLISDVVIRAAAALLILSAAFATLPHWFYSAALALWLIPALLITH